MPNRILKDSVCASDSIDRLTWFQEVFFYRLIVNCDDYGRMDARPRILAARLFPLKDYDDVSDYMIESTLEMLSNAGLITLYKVDDKPYLQMKTWDKHQQVRAKRSKYPSPSEITCNQVIADDYKCPRNPIQSVSESLSESVSESEEFTDAAAHAIRQEQQKVWEAAENSGFMMTPVVTTKLVNLYAEFGLDKMLNAINECATHSAITLAYLEAVLRGNRRVKPKVNAQAYEQRDYQEVQDEIMRKQNERIMERLKGGTG